MKSRFALLALLVLLTHPLYGLDLTKGESGRIARLVGQILSSNHLRQEALNNRLSKLALQNYLDALDVNHQVFIQPDVDEFREKYSDKIDDLTLAERDAQPAYIIYDRYMERLAARVADVDELLKADYDFEQDETLDLKRSKKPWPKTVEESRELWRKRIKSDILQGRLQKEDKETVTERLTKRYTRLLKSMRQLEADEILQIYLTSIGSAYDPHSTYMSPSEAENFQIHSVTLKLSGIGALLRSEDGYCKIVSLVPGGPAELSEQIKPNDRIVAVGQGEAEPVDVVEMKLNKVVDMIRGERGTEVKLTVIPASSVDGSERKIVSLVRDVIQLKEQQAKAKVIDLPQESGEKLRLGVIDLPQYYENSARDVRQIINRMKLEDVNGIVLDLRQNGGGILDEAVKLTGLFFQKGPVVQVRDFQNSVTILSDKDPRIAYDGPLIVLVSRLSASASEITAAALQDYGRAIVVGDEATHGKGTVQTLQDLNRIMRRFRGPKPDQTGMLKYTISNFYRVAGTTTQKYGVKPDIILPSVYDYMEIGEEHLPNSLEPDKIPAADYDQLARTQPYIESLKQNSTERVNRSTDFAYVKEDIDRYVELKERETVSLKESVRLEEKEADKARADTRKKEREAREIIDEDAFLLTLDATKNAEPLVLLPFLAAEEPEKEKEDEDEDEEAASEASSEKSENEGEDGEEDEATRKYDPHLREALNILADYIKELEKNPPTPVDPNLS